MKKPDYIKPELLAPAGDMEKLKMAVAYGADAVYMGGVSYGLRGFAGNFTNEQLPEAVKYAHDHGVKVHVTVNIMARNEEVAKLPEYLAFLDSIGVDALIIADMGAFSLAQKYAPHCERHVSTQVSIANYETACAWYKLGATRVVLARELSLKEIREIREKTPPELEIETFAHGSMCVSYSGRCLLSNYMTGRDGNGGECAQSCRFPFTLMKENEGHVNYESCITSEETPALYHLVSDRQPGEFYPVLEDERGTYIMNSNDMCMIDHMEELLDAGIDCLKIEGRGKSPYYAAIITGAYRHVIDACARGEEPDPVWLDEVNHVSHRHYSTGFYYGYPGQHYDKKRYIREWQIAGIILSCDENGLATVSLKNKIRTGASIEIVGPDTKPYTMIAPVMHDMDGNELTEPKNTQMLFTMQLDKKVPELSIIRQPVNLSAK